MYPKKRSSSLRVFFCRVGDVKIVCIGCSEGRSMKKIIGLAVLVQIFTVRVYAMQSMTVRGNDESSKQSEREFQSLLSSENLHENIEKEGKMQLGVKRDVDNKNDTDESDDGECELLEADEGDDEEDDRNNGYTSYLWKQWVYWRGYLSFYN